MAGERQNGRKVVDNLVDRQVRQRKREGKPTTAEDLRAIKERARQSRLRGERRRNQD